MKRLRILGAGLLMLSACAAPTRQDIDELRAMQEVTCASRPGTCSYENSPLKVSDRTVTLPRRPYAFRPVAQTLHFTDAQRRQWTAPRGILTDGASIPPLFVSIVGQPTAPEYINAGALHDAYCGVGNEGTANFHNGRWQDVHRMFFDALVAAGTPEQRAKVLFAAVWLGGPRWDYHVSLQEVPQGAMQQAMRQAKRYIEERDPSLSELEAYLLRLEKGIIRSHPDLFAQLLPDGGEGPRQGYEAPVEDEAEYEPPVRDEPVSEEPGQEFPDEYEIPGDDFTDIEL
ncbi:DUF1353 domain-containing protein [bacterium]|nr:DUF1353 domain-containing protein [bacterium]